MMKKMMMNLVIASRGILHVVRSEYIIVIDDSF